MAEKISPPLLYSNQRFQSPKNERFMEVIIHAKTLFLVGCHKY